MRSRLGTLMALALLLGAARAGAQEEQEEEDLEVQQQAVDAELDQEADADDADSPEVQRPADVIDSREQKARDNFDTIMNNQPVLLPAKRAPSPSQALPIPPPGATAGRTSEATVGLNVFQALRDRLKAIEERQARSLAPLVVLGASRYAGEATEGALALRLALEVTLGQKGAWKVVPLVGDDVVLVRAAVGGRSVPVSRRQGFHVWVTNMVGEATVDVELLVPARGPRGSIEFDFSVARTPLTQFSCRFPLPGLEPRVHAAVRTAFSSEAGGTRVTAVLRPTNRINLLGLRELGDQGAQPAKVTVESLNLLSVDEEAIELFAVLRYTILYAGTREFNVKIPAGMTVESADGMGAFSFTQDGDLLRGETAFPIRNQYEISLRLKRLLKSGEVFVAPLPRADGVAGQSGWLAVEVPGKLKLEEQSQEGMTGVDPRELPEEMVRSAVSPILKAYAFHSAKAGVQLSATRLPEIEPKSASIDSVKAFTSVTQEGAAITDLRITLRNRLRPHLRLTLPKGAKLSTALLDGEPFKPSQDEQGNILVPLKRSRGRDQLEPFTLSLVFDQPQDALGWFGAPSLRLPALDLPVSSLAWSVWVPARNWYSRLWSDIENQAVVERAGWQAPMQLGELDGQGAPSEPQAVTAYAPATSETGAMPVRIRIPKDGIRLSYARYWIDADAPIEVGFTYVRAWLLTPLWLLLSALSALGVLLFSTRKRHEARPLVVWGGAALALAALVAGARIGGIEAVFLALLLAFIACAVFHRWALRAPAALAEWALTLLGRFRERARDPRAWRGAALARRIVATVLLCWFGLMLLGMLPSLVSLLFSPLP